MLVPELVLVPVVELAVVLVPELVLVPVPELLLVAIKELLPVAIAELLLVAVTEVLLVAIAELLLVPVPVHPQPKQSTLSGVPGGPSTPQWSCMRLALPSAVMLTELPAHLPPLQNTSTAGAAQPRHLLSQVGHAALAAILFAADTTSAASVQSLKITQQSEFFVHVIGPAVSEAQVAWSPVHPDALLDPPLFLLELLPVPEPWPPSTPAVLLLLEQCTSTAPTAKANGKAKSVLRAIHLSGVSVA